MLCCSEGCYGVVAHTHTPAHPQVLSNEAVKKEVLDRTPMKRVGQPAEVAGARATSGAVLLPLRQLTGDSTMWCQRDAVPAAVFAFLASPAASYVAGQTIAVDGGHSVMGLW